MTKISSRNDFECYAGAAGSRLDKWLPAAAAVFLLVLLGLELQTIFRIDVWRHDAVYYFDTYQFKLVQEGRWIIYFLFPLLQKIPAHLSILLHLACLWFFGYCCCKYFTKDRAFAAVFGLALLQVHPCFSIFGWPVTSLSTLITLAALAAACHKMPLPLFFLVAGILFHGQFNNFYDLLPLLFLREINDRGLKYFIWLLFLWCLGFLIGYGVAESVVYLESGQLITISSWRAPHPVKNFGDLVFNINRMAEFCRTHLETLLLRRTTQAALGLGLLLPLFAKYRDRAGLARLYAALLGVALSVYIQTCPIGIKVHLRTVFPLYIGLLSVFILGYREHMKEIAVLLLCAAAFGLFQDDLRTVRYHYTVTSELKNEFQKLYSDPSQFKGVKFSATNDEMGKCVEIIMRENHLENKLTEGFGSAMRWCPTAQSSGFADVTYESVSAALPPAAPDKMYRSKAENGYLVVGINQAYLAAHGE